MLEYHQSVWHLEAMKTNEKAFHLSKIGFFQAGPGTRYFLSSTAWFAHFIFQGRGIFKVDDREFEATPGTIVFFWPGSKCLYYNTGNGNWNYTWVKFGGTGCEAALAKIGISSKKPCIRISDWEACELQARQIFHQLNKSSPSSFRPYAAAWEFLEMIQERTIKQSPSPIPVIQHAQALIDDPTGNLPSVSELADKLEIGRVTLFRLFRDQLHTTPKEYIDRVRHIRAREMLIHSDLKIRDISKFCGFSSQKYFSDWFRRKSGHTPSKHRQKTLQPTS